MESARPEESSTESGSLVARQIRDWSLVPHVVDAVFRTGDGEEIERTVDAFCVKTLGSRVAVHECFDASVASVHGVRLIDGRRITVKARRGGKSTAGVAAAQTAQRHLSTSGFPCPTPLVGPTPLGAGVATVETTLEAGQRGDPHEPELRRAMAVTLVRLVELCRPLRLEGIEAGSELPGGLWPEPHDARFDFERTSMGAEWIDALAVRARARIVDGSPMVIGHRDWRAENLRFASAQVVAVYDWDSLGVLSEPELAGGAAHYFTSDFRVEGRRQLPTLEEALAFIDDYETARWLVFSRQERQTARAALVNAMAYTARCEHSDALTSLGGRPPAPPPGAFPDGSARAFLIRHSEELLSPAPPS